MNFKKRTYSLNNKKVVFLLVGWKSQIWKYFYVIFVLLFNGFDCIIYEYDSEILSPNIEKTAISFNKVTSDILKTINEFDKKGYNDIFLFGTSLGSSLSMIVANKTSSVKKIILNLTGASLAKTVWSWNNINKQFKKDLDNQKLTLTTLEKSWKKLSPVNNLDNIFGKKILIYLAEKDEVIPFSHGLYLIKEFKKRKITHKLIVNKKSGHILSGFINLLKYRKYIDFLKD